MNRSAEYANVSEHRIIENECNAAFNSTIVFID